ncbi:MAG: sugar nucleotide-binding protein, partial [Anaerolineales bacterium]
DQVSGPTWSLRLAGATVEVLRQCIQAGRVPENCRGVYHLASGSAVSRYGWAKAILHHAGQDVQPKVVPVESSEFPTAAVRPRYSALDCTKLDDRFGIRLPEWQYDLSLMLTARHLPESEVAALAAVA